MTDEANQRLNEVDSQLAKLKVEMTKALRWAEESRADTSKTGTRGTIFFAVSAVLALAGVGLGVWALVRKPHVATDTLQAQRLEIRDASGNARIVAEGNAIKLFDPAGKQRGLIEVGSEGEMRILFGREHDRMLLSVDREGQPVINLYDIMGRVRLGMGILNDTANPVINLTNEKGTRTLSGP